MMKLVCCVVLPVILFCENAGSQVNYRIFDSIVEKMYWCALQKPATTLYVHFDKNIYTNNENVWFTGYLLKNDIAESHSALSVALIRNDDRSVLADGKFVMDKVCRSGTSFYPTLCQPAPTLFCATPII